MPAHIFDCLGFLQSQSAATISSVFDSAKLSLLQACVQAEATRHAGKLAARAATNSALITLAAGLSALGGGGLALWGSYLQVQHIRHREAAKKLVCARRVLPIIQRASEGLYYQRQRWGHDHLLQRHAKRQKKASKLIATDIYLPTIIADIDEFGWKKMSVLGAKALSLMLDIEHQLSFYFYDAHRMMREREPAPEASNGQFMLSSQDMGLLAYRALVASAPMDKLLDELKILALPEPPGTFLRRLRHRLHTANVPGFRGKYDRVP